MKVVIVRIRAFDYSNRIKQYKIDQSVASTHKTKIAVMEDGQYLGDESLQKRGGRGDIRGGLRGRRGGRQVHLRYHQCTT